nr:hypothetical protein [Desulfurispirillum indicum]
MAILSIHHPMDKAQQQPAGNQRSLLILDPLQKGQWRALGLGTLGRQALHTVVKQGPETLNISLGQGKLKRTHANMAPGNTGQNRPRQHLFPIHRLTRCHHCQTARRRYPKRRHGFADNILPEHRPKRGPPITITGIAGPPRTLQLNIPPPPLHILILTQKMSATITQMGEVTKLMTTIGLGQRLTSREKSVATEKLRFLQSIKPGKIHIQGLCKLVIP